MQMNMEFQVAQTAGTINTNFDELEKQLADKLAEYKGAVFTEDSKQIAKGELASLRKLKTAINDRKKDIKNTYMQPYTEFENRVKRLIAMVDEPICLIDEQVKAFDEKRREEKRARIQEVYQEHIGEIEQYLPLVKIYDSKWENASTSIKNIENDITDAVQKASMDVQTIRTMQSDAVEEALEIYKANLSLAEAMQYINNYERQKTEILNREKEKEIEEIRADERKRVAEEQKIAERAKAAAVEEIASVDKKQAEPLTLEGSSTVVYTVVATPEEQREIEMALTSLGVYFERKDVR